ncbi:MAG TPA: AgmX/PglI C-terminal domain-containing protein [Caldithrix abyssi]|uniref:AgmX/PglI C-terminal domain-containing protein n=1 Tax=Caldithrix abyssi TaxID=187145 RepID=A0A7V1LPN1_CALAY|nr:AgmX/PglI C-terminal domain-containing protein [Caldithrix abyssi]
MYQTDFDLYFAKRIGDRLPGRFLSIFSVVLFLTVLIIIFLGTYDYPALQPQVHQVLKERFQSLILEQEQPQPVRPLLEEALHAERAAGAREEMKVRKKKIQKSGLLGELEKQKSPYENLPELDNMDIDASSIGFEELSYLPPAGHFGKGRQRARHVRSETLNLDDLLREPYDYKIKREADLALDVPAMLTSSERRYGYRDQNEVLTVLYRKQNIIQNCFKKALRNNSISRGAIKVEFEIDPRGFVIPSSVRILDSTLRNRLVEQCIKKNISRWRNFARLEETLPSHVVHKFIFN